MPRNSVIRAYCQRVGKALELPRKPKRNLLKGLEKELEDRFSSVDGLTLEALCMAVGTPEESAAALMECIDEKERIQYRTRCRRIAKFAIVGLVILSILVTAYFTYMTRYDVKYAEVKIIQNDTE